MGKGEYALDALGGLLLAVGVGVGLVVEVVFVLEVDVLVGVDFHEALDALVAGFEVDDLEHDLAVVDADHVALLDGVEEVRLVDRDDVRVAEDLVVLHQADHAVGLGIGGRRVTLR